MTAHLLPRLQRFVRGHPRSPGEETHEATASQPPALRLLVPQTHIRPADTDHQGKVDAHGQTALFALTNHIPAVPAHRRDGLAALAPIAQRDAIRIAVTHARTRTETERSGQGMIPE